MDKDNTKQPVPEDKKAETPDELEICKEKMEEYLNGWKRARADYSNLKKDFEKEKEELIKFANIGLVLQLLPIHSHFKKALLQVPEDQKKSAWVEGVVQIKRQLDNLFKLLQLEEIKTVGEKFNPEFHEAVNRIKKEGRESGVIVEEVEAGYKMYDKVVAAAKVVVIE